jgi:GT2 family glycosyltransferase
MSARVLIVIVNYRTAALAVEALRALASQNPGGNGARVVVTDNASGDGSVEHLHAAISREGWGRWASVVPLGRNGGFAYGNNAGIRIALASPESFEYVMLLNPDTVARPGAVEVLLGFMDANPGAGIAGSSLEDATGRLDCSAHNFPSPLGELEGGARLGILSRIFAAYAVSPRVRDETHPCDWVSGASMLIRTDVIRQVGLLDEGYFLYFEEVDFCHRARSAGWTVWYVPDSRVVHLEGASTGVTVTGRRRPAYWYDSRRRYFLKHFGKAGLVAADVLLTIGRASYLVRRALRLGASSASSDPRHFMKDLIGGDLRALLSGKSGAARSAGVP